MRRHLLTFALTGLFGALLLSSDASACCHKKRACAPAPCAPVACVQPAPCPPPAPVCEPCPPPTGCCKKKFNLFGGLCHKRRACAQPAVVVCASPAPVIYAPAPSPQGAPSGQGY
jgi:hypothetical protein